MYRNVHITYCDKSVISESPTLLKIILSIPVPWVISPFLFTPLWDPRQSSLLS